MIEKPESIRLTVAHRAVPVRADFYHCSNLKSGPASSGYLVTFETFVFRALDGVEHASSLHMMVLKIAVVCSPVVGTSASTTAGSAIGCP